MRIISFIDQPGVIRKFFSTLVYGMSSPAPPEGRVLGVALD